MVLLYGFYMYLIGDGMGKGTHIPLFFSIPTQEMYAFRLNIYVVNKHTHCYIHTLATFRTYYGYLAMHSIYTQYRLWRRMLKSMCLWWRVWNKKPRD